MINTFCLAKLDNLVSPRNETKIPYEILLEPVPLKIYFSLSVIYSNNQRVVLFESWICRYSLCFKKALITLQFSRKTWSFLLTQKQGPNLKFWARIIIQSCT